MLRSIPVFFAVFFVFSLAGCGGSSTNGNDGGSLRLSRWGVLVSAVRHTLGEFSGSVRSFSGAALRHRQFYAGEGERYESR